MKCRSCGRRRQLRGWVLCDECAEEWWLADGGYEWRTQMRRWGYAVIPDAYRVGVVEERVATIAEVRWRPSPARSVPSPLWDAATASSA